MARPPFKPDEKQRTAVAIMAACGMPQDYICQQIINPQTRAPINKRTLERAFREELDAGMEQANAQVKMALFKKATGNGPQSVTAAIFWLKCRAGWKPTEGLELTGKDGTPLPGGSIPALSEEQLVKLARKINDEV
jgi:hypothetical protein